ncbi:MAG: hypothetical protein MJ067_01665 [Oscillospiraceae bacterium]|nr:hypothetical protein [Oscillospiraceae bacterium]
MKKVLALVLCMLMVFSLVACGSGDSTDAKKDEGATTAPTTNEGNPDASSKDGYAENTDVETSKESDVATPHMNEDGSINLNDIANYDPNYDYSQNPKFKFAYLASSADVLYQQSADAYEIWCKQFNLEWAGFVSSNGDNEAYMNNLQTYIDKGVELFVLDPDSTIFPAVGELMEEYEDAGVVWMSQMSPPRDGENAMGNLINNHVGFDNYGMSYACGQKLIDWKNENCPEIPWSEMGVAAITYAIVPLLNERCQAVIDCFAENTDLNAEDVVAMDVAAAGFTMQGAMDVFAPVVSNNSDKKGWLVFGMIDDCAIGCASGIENVGLTATSCAISIGGAGLQTEFDAGHDTAYRYAYCTPNLIYAEPIIGAIYAIKMGWTDKEEIWPSWVQPNDHGADGHTYSMRGLPIWFLEKDMYKEFYEWTDSYCGCNYYPYDKEGVTAAPDLYTALIGNNE